MISEIERVTIHFLKEERSLIPIQSIENYKCRNGCFYKDKHNMVWSKTGQDIAECILSKEGIEYIKNNNSIDIKECDLDRVVKYLTEEDFVEDFEQLDYYS